MVSLVKNANIADQTGKKRKAEPNQPKNVQSTKPNGSKTHRHFLYNEEIFWFYIF